MDRQTFVMAIKKYAFLPQDLTDQIVKAADDLSEGTRRKVIIAIEKMAKAFLELLDEELRAMTGLERTVKHKVQIHEEESVREEEMKNLPKFDAP